MIRPRAAEGTETGVSDPIALLRSFHRKERQLLLSEVLRREEDEEVFRLGDGFRERLGVEIGVAVHPGAYVAMDYHLDWLGVALRLAAASGPPEPIPNDGWFKATQEDIDLLVAFRDEDETHVVLIEAKGVTGWNNAQLASKAERLRRIFGDGPGFGLATPHFVLMSPKRPVRIGMSDWPGWMCRPDGKPHWLELSLPGGLRKATRCDADGNDTAEGGYLRIDTL